MLLGTVFLGRVGTAVGSTRHDNVHDLPGANKSLRLTATRAYGDTLSCPTFTLLLDCKLSQYFCRFLVNLALADRRSHKMPPGVESYATYVCQVGLEQRTNRLRGTKR